jgi:hypothetical protein
MQFDAAQSGHYVSKVVEDWAVAHERIDAMYENENYPTPRIVYWNLNSRDSMGHPAHSETKNVVMLSGFSQASLKTFLAGDLVPEIEEVINEKNEVVKQKVQKDPWEVLCAILDKYHWIMECMEKTNVFPGYEAPVQKDEENDDK